MDLLKNLKNLSIDSEEDEQRHTGNTPTLPPTASPRHNIFDKIGDALNDRKSSPAPASIPQVIAPIPQAHKEENLFSKIGDSLSGRKTPPPPPVAEPVPQKEENLFHKLGDAISGKHTPPPQSVASPRPHKEENLLSKIGGAISGRKTPPPPPEPKKDENLFHKIGDAISGKRTPPPEPARTSLVDKLAETITGKKEEKQSKPEGLIGKINNALGGGAKGEQEEDKLDKAIDLFQEHILKQGAQDNESALEQAKDKEIAEAIRKATGLGLGSDKNKK